MIASEVMYEHLKSPVKGRSLYFFSVLRELSLLRSDERAAAVVWTVLDTLLTGFLILG